MLKKFLIYLGILLSIGSININSQSAGFISEPGIESDSAFVLLQSNIKFSKRISPQDVNDNDYDMIWIHGTDTSQNSFTQEDIDEIKDYIFNGGSLLLTLEAFQLIYDLGLEKIKPELRYAAAIDEGYGRKSGFHAFIDHRIFSQGLFGGAYVWDAQNDNTTRMWGYFDNNIPDGKTVAVDWSYITLKENSKIILEYRYGKGKILAVGAYTFYSPGNNNKQQLIRFTTNCFYYLAGSKFEEKNYFWNYDTPSVNYDKNLNLNSLHKSLSANPDQKHLHSFSKSTSWGEKEVLNIKSLYASDNYWDVAGQKILIMGKEKGGIDEIWIHPVMTLRDYEVGIQFSYRDTIYWLNDERPSFEVSPAYIKRVYNFKRAFLTEIISADPEKPAGVIHYEYRGVYPAKLYIKVKSNLRFMWPYSEHAFRDISYNYTENYLIFSTNPEGLNFYSAIGINKKPAFIHAGQFEDYIKKDSVFTGVPTKNMEVSGIIIADLEMNDNIDVTFSGGDVSSNEYTGINSHPFYIYSRSVDYVRSFFKNTIGISTPDENINAGIKWALIGSDKFYVNTEIAGFYNAASLVAGYSTTARGWGGGHSINGRPGYAWYFGRDAQWSGFALLDYGDFDKVKNIIKTFNTFQDLNGKIYHELTTSGAVHYDAADATPLYIILCGKYLKHSGDMDFIRNYYGHIYKAIEYCYSTDTDGDKLIENTNVGHGWVEGGSLYGAHTTLYLASIWAEALNNAAYIAQHIGFQDHADRFLSDYKTVKDIVNKNFWNAKDNFYYYGKFKDDTYNPEKTVLPSIPLYFEQTDTSKALNVLDDYAGNGFTSDWGVRILSSESPLFNPAGYHYGSVWPLFTGWTALAEYKYGNYLQGYSHMLNNLNVYRNFSKGYVEEVLNGAVYKPSGVCPHQCWSETMVLQPLIEGMLGLKTDAMKNEISLSPRFPADWKYASVINIKAGKNSLSFLMKKETDIIYTFEGDSGMSVFFNPALPLLSDISEVTLNSKQINYELIRGHQNLILKTNFTTAGKTEIRIKLKEGVAVLPYKSNPAEGDSSSGLRIISTDYKDSTLTVIVEGKSFTEPELRIYAPNFNISSDQTKVSKETDEIFSLKIPFDTGSGYIRKELTISLK